MEKPQNGSRIKKDCASQQESSTQRKPERKKKCWITFTVAMSMTQRERETPKRNRHSRVACGKCRVSLEEASETNAGGNNSYSGAVVIFVVVVLICCL